MPAGPFGAARVVADSGAEPSRAERGAHVQIPAGLTLELPEAADADGAAGGATENQDVGAGIGGEHLAHYFRVRVPDSKFLSTLKMRRSLKPATKHATANAS